jgi:hypothetical protein
VRPGANCREELAVSVEAISWALGQLADADAARSEAAKLSQEPDRL